MKFYKLFVLGLTLLLPVAAIGDNEKIGLLSLQNNKYVRGGVGNDSLLAAVSPQIKGWETFELIRLNGNKIALKSIQNGKYVRAGVGKGTLLAAASPQIKGWETFELIRLDEDRIALKSVQNGKYVRAGVGKGTLLAAVSSQIGGWETFRMTSGAGCVPPVLESLTVTLHPQETTHWCWAASGQMTMEYLGRNVTQCVQANNRFGRNDCCNTPTPSWCIQGGWPEYKKYGFTFTRTNSAALSWDQLRAELSDNDDCGNRAIAFTWAWPGGGGHVMTAIGYKTENGVNYVEVNDPWSPNVGDHRFDTYDYYVDSPGHHSHWDDFYEISRSGSN